jgi:hypothetical protein
LHYDHYSGFADLLEYCIKHTIKIDILYHTFSVEYFTLFTSILVTQNQFKTTRRFLSALDLAVKSKVIIDIDNASKNSKAIALTDNISLSFLSPIGGDVIEFSQVKAKHDAHLTTSVPDLNNLATIILIKGENNKSILLTSDAPKKAFKRINKLLGSIFQLVQSSHHGSKKNLFEDFWSNLLIEKNCPAIFSVGNVKRDKLPNIETVKFFDEVGFHNESTNFVHGIAEYYKPIVTLPPRTNTTSRNLSLFSKLKKVSSTPLKLPARFIGERDHHINL